MPDKENIARILAAAHRKYEPAIVRIVRLLGEQENENGEPVKLLELNLETWASGIWPVAFTPDPPEIPYGSVIVEVTPDEYQSIVNKKLLLPHKWTSGDTLYP